MCAPLGSGESVDLVDDDVLDAPQDLRCLAGEDQVERFGRSDQDVGRVLDEVAPFPGGRVAGPDADFDLRHRLAQPFGGQPDPGQRRPQVALNVVDEGLEGRDVQDADGRGRWRRFVRKTVQHPQKRGQSLAAPRWGVDQGVATGRDARPATDLGRRRRLEGRTEPLPDGGAEGCQWIATPGARLGRSSHEADSIGSRRRLDHAFCSAGLGRGVAAQYPSLLRLGRTMLRGANIGGASRFLTP